MNKKRLHFITVACAFIALITMFVVSGCAKSSAPKYTLTVTAGEGGTVNSNGGLYVKGKLISIVATPNVGYEFDGWHNGGTKISSLQTYEFDMPEGDLSLEARFIKIVIVKYDLTVTAGLGGVVNAVDGMYLAGQLVILIAVPNGGYNFAGWYDGDAEVSLSATYELYMPLHNLNLQARFDIDMTPTEGFLFEPINYMGDVVQEGSHVAYQISVGTAARDGRAAIVIPSVHKGKPVTKIADYGFCDNDSKNNYARTNLINAIIIPSSITSIGNSAFSYCSILKSITIPDGITRLSNKMFSGCTYLVSVTLPSGITEIGDYAFQNCKCLSQIAT